MVILVDQASSEPIYLQIRSQIIAAIASGELEVGDGLPSVRSLAADLGVNLHTVNKAYAVLRDEGYLLMRGRAGAIVADRSVASVRRRGEEQDERMVQGLRRLALAHRARGGTESEFIEEAARQARLAFSVVGGDDEVPPPANESEGHARDEGVR